MPPRVATKLLVAALIRRAEAEGGFAAVLARGDPTAGSVLLILAERGRRRWICERILGADGQYGWRRVDPQGLEGEEATENFLSRRRKFDPDLWIVELDIASVERFAAEMTDFG